MSLLPLSVNIRAAAMALKDRIPLNWELIGNPVNWVMVALMIAIATVALALVVKPGKSLLPTNEGEE